MRSLLRRVLFRLFWNTYDALGTWALLGLCVSFAALPLVTIPALFGALLHCAARAEGEYSIAFEDFKTGLRRFWGRSTLMGLLAFVCLAVTLMNLLFYARAVLPLPPLLRFGLAGLFGWIGLYALMVIHIGWAFLVMQDLPIGKALRRGLLITLAHPLTCLMLLAWGLLLLVLFGFTGLGLLLLGGPLAANLLLGTASGAVELYEEREDRIERERLEREGMKTWTERRVLEEREAARARKYQRTFREILRPWEMK